MEKAKKDNRIVMMVLAVLGLVALQVVFPVSIYGPTFLQNSKLYRYEQLSLYIEKFKEAEGRLPKSFGEVDIKFKDELQGIFSSFAKEYDSNGLIVDCTDAEITFEIEAVWTAKDNDNLVWARTTDGQVIRFSKELLKAENK